jgi:threonine dehydrogenase-like Zn-dependent dehydrogenase
MTAKLTMTAGIDRLAAFYSAIDVVHRGGTISLSGVYGGMANPLPMMTLFDKQIKLRMGQATYIAGCRRSCRCPRRTTR